MTNKDAIDQNLESRIKSLEEEVAEAIFIEECAQMGEPAYIDDKTWEDVKKELPDDYNDCIGRARAAIAIVDKHYQNRIKDLEGQILLLDFRVKGVREIVNNHKLKGIPEIDSRRFDALLEQTQ